MYYCESDIRLQVLRDLCELEEWKHDGDDNRSDDGTDKYDDERFERCHEIRDKSFQFFGVVLSYFFDIFPDSTRLFSDTDHMNQIFWKEGIVEARFFVVPDGETHGITELDSGLYFVLDADDIFLELDIGNYIGSSFQCLEHEYS